MNSTSFRVRPGTLQALGLAVVVAAGALATTAIDARRGGDPERRLKRMKRHLKLNDGQVAKIRAIHKKYRPRHKALRKQIRTEKRGIHKLMQRSADRSAVKSKFEAVSKLKVEKRMLWFDQHREILSILNKDQQAKLKKHMKKRMERKRKRHRRGRRGRKGCD